MTAGEVQVAAPGMASQSGPAGQQLATPGLAQQSGSAGTQVATPGAASQINGGSAQITSAPRIPAAAYPLLAGIPISTLQIAGLVPCKYICREFAI